MKEIFDTLALHVTLAFELPLSDMISLLRIRMTLNSPLLLLFYDGALMLLCLGLYLTRVSSSLAKRIVLGISDGPLYFPYKPSKLTLAVFIPKTLA